MEAHTVMPARAVMVTTMPVNDVISLFIAAHFFRQMFQNPPIPIGIFSRSNTVRAWNTSDVISLDTIKLEFSIIFNFQWCNDIKRIVWL